MDKKKKYSQCCQINDSVLGKIGMSIELKQKLLYINFLSKINAVNNNLQQ